MHDPSHSIEHRRTLNIFVLSMLSLGVVISLRNLPLTAEYGLSSLFFYVIAALFFMIPYALISAELASGWPKSGGVYIWVKEALGERWGFFAIWMQWFHNVTWYPAMLAFIGAGIAYLFDPALATNKVYLISVILVGFWGITFLNFLGIKTSAWFSTLCIVIGTIVPGIVLIALAATWLISGEPSQINFRADQLLPDLSHPTNLAFMAGIFLALSGLEANANLARDVKNPQRNYPRAIFIAAAITLCILVFGSMAIAIVIPKNDIGLVTGLLEAFQTFFNAFHLSWLIPVIAIFTVLGAIGELNAWAIAAAKGLFVTTEYGALPPVLHKVNTKHVPTRILLFQAIIVTVAAFIFLYHKNVHVSYWILSALTAQMYLMMYILLFIAGIVLRYKKPEVPRPYKLPFRNAGMWVAVIVGICASLFVFFLSFLPPSQFEAGNTVSYETLLIVSSVLIFVLPLLIFSFRKPSWRRNILADIRDEIHRSTH